MQRNLVRSRIPGRQSKSLACVPGEIHAELKNQLGRPDNFDEFVHPFYVSSSDAGVLNHSRAVLVDDLVLDAIVTERADRRARVTVEARVRGREIGGLWFKAQLASRGLEGFIACPLNFYRLTCGQVSQDMA